MTNLRIEVVIELEAVYQLQLFFLRAFFIRCHVRLHCILVQKRLRIHAVLIRASLLKIHIRIT